MFEAKGLLFIYVETPLHAGTGRGLGAVDLPIQRERTTGYPIVQASSVKGRLRAEAKGKIPDAERLAIFGPEAGNASDHAGAMSAGDARVLLFPVRSLAGVLAWVTSADILYRFRREAAMVGLAFDWGTMPDPGKEEAFVNGNALKAGESVVLEEFSFTPKEYPAVATIAKWLADNALPQFDEYKYWRDALLQKLCILPEDACRDFLQYSTEVQTHIKLHPETKTVAGTALWTSESLPVDTLLYAPLMATKSRANGVSLTADQILQKVTALNMARTQLGGDETTGQGMVALRFAGGSR